MPFPKSLDDCLSLITTAREKVEEQEEPDLSVLKNLSEAIGILSAAVQIFKTVDGQDRLIEWLIENAREGQSEIEAGWKKKPLAGTER